MIEDISGTKADRDHLSWCPGRSLVRAQQLAEKIRATVHAWCLQHACQSLSVGTSIGVTAVTPELADMAAVMQAADNACYAAKKGGRNRVVTRGAGGPLH